MLLSNSINFKGSLYEQLLNMFRNFSLILKLLFFILVTEPKITCINTFGSQFFLTLCHLLRSILKFKWKLNQIYETLYDDKSDIFFFFIYQRHVVIILINYFSMYCRGKYYLLNFNHLRRSNIY